MAFIDPYDKNPPEQDSGETSTFIDPYDEEGSGTKLRKGSLKDQIHDVASGGTAALDLLTMLPGMVGGAIGTGVGMMVHGSKSPAQDLLRGIGEGGEMTSASNLLGINESDPNYRERPGYKAVMKPVEAITQAMHLAGKGVGKAAEAGWLGSDRANSAAAAELAAGTELGLMAALPFVRRPAAAPGSRRAYQETVDAPKQGERSFNEARDTYPVEQPTKPFDIREFKDPFDEAFAPEFRPSQFEGPDEAVMQPAQRGFRDTLGTEDPYRKSEPKLTEQDYFGTTEGFRNTGEVRPIRDFDDIPHQIDKMGHTVSPAHEVPRSNALPTVAHDAATAAEPLPFRFYDPARVADQVAAADKPGFLRSAEEVMRARELERAENPRDRSTSEPIQQAPAERRVAPQEVPQELRKAPFDYTKIDAEINKHLEAFLNGKNGARGKLNPSAMGDIGPGRKQRGGPKKEEFFWTNRDANWKSTDIYPDKPLEQQSRLDVIKNKGGGYVVEGPRRVGDSRTHSHLAEFNTIRAAQEYAKDYAKYLRGEIEKRPSSLDRKYDEIEYSGKKWDGIRENLLGDHAPASSNLGDKGPGRKQRGGPLNDPNRPKRIIPRMRNFEDVHGSPEYKRFREQTLDRTYVDYNAVSILKSDIQSSAREAANELRVLQNAIRSKEDAVTLSLRNPGTEIYSTINLRNSEFASFEALLKDHIANWEIRGRQLESLSEELFAQGPGKNLGDKGPGRKQRGGPLWEIKRRGGPTKALQEEAREMSLEGRHNTPIEKVVEKIANNRIEDFTAERSNQFWNAVARLGSLVKENLLIDTSIRQIMKDKMGSGPIIKWVVDSVSHIERKQITDTKAAVNEGLTDLRRMYNTPSLRKQGLEMWKKWQENIDVRDLTRADFTTERQWNVYSKMRAQDDIMLEKVNKLRVEAGLEPIDRIPSHFRGMWEGDYRVFGYDAAGNKKAAFGFETEWGAKKGLEIAKKRHPNLTFEYDHVKTDQYGIGNLSAFEDAIRIMTEKNDPVAKALQATYREILQHRGFGRTGVHRKGVAGFMGSEGGLLGLRNMEKAYEQHITQGYRYISNLEKQKVLADLQSVPKELWNKMPNTKEFLESYIRKTQGKKLRDAGWIDGTLIGISKAIGFGEHGPLKAVRGLSTVATLWWLTTPRFLISQSVQSLNSVPKLVQRFGQIDAAKAYFTGLHRAIDKSARDSIANEAIKWASERGYLDATIHNLMEKGWSGRPIGSVAETLKETLSWPAQGIERKLVRTPVFLAFEDALRPYIKDKVQRFEEAAEYADYYMVNYGGSHTPMAYNKMGLTGEMAKPLKQYSHNTWGQFFEYSRNLKNKGEVAPLAYFLGIQASVAGLKGMMIVAEVTAIIALLNYVFELDIPTPEQLMLKYGVHDALVYGGLSYALQHDVSASVSAPGIPNMFSVPPIQFTARMVGDLGNYVIKKAKGEDTDQDRLRALLAITPNAMHEWIKGFYTEEGQPTANPYDANLRGNYRRGTNEVYGWDENIMSQMLGAKPLNEARADALMRAVKQDLQRDLKQKTSAAEAIVDRIMNGQGIDEKLMRKYIEQGGSPARLPDLIRSKIRERMQTGPERTRNIRNITPGNAHKLEVLEDYLNEIDERLNEEHGSYKWDPRSGDIVTVGFGSDQPVGLDGKRVYNDTEPPPTMPGRHGYDIDKKMKTGPKERSESEYRTPQIDPYGVFKQRARDKGGKPNVRM